MPLDVTRQAEIDLCVNRAEAELGGIDILINNAALFDRAPIVEITRADYDRCPRGQCRRHALHAAGGREER